MCRLDRSFHGLLVGATLLLAVHVLVGCAQPKGSLLVAPEPPIVWPRPPDDPRVRFVGQLTGSADLNPAKSLGDRWREALYGPESPTSLVTPFAVAVRSDGMEVAVADTNIGGVHVFGLPDRQFRLLRSGKPEGLLLETPVGVCYVGDDLYVADAKLAKVVRSSSGGLLHEFGSRQLSRPASLACAAQAGRIYVVDSATHNVITFGPDGDFLFEFGGRGSATGMLNFPSQIAIHESADPSASFLAVADSLNFRVQLFTLDGAPLGVLGGKGDAAGDFALPKGVAIDARRNIWVADAQFENVQAFNPEGRLLMAFGGEGQRPGEFWLPAQLCIDRQRRLWVADSYNRRVQVFELLRGSAGDRSGQAGAS